MNCLTFKQLVKEIASVAIYELTIETENYLAGEIDRSFQHDKISYSDHQLLFALLNKINWEKE